MKDFNFFEPYIEKDFKISKQLVLNLIILFSIVSLVGYGIFNQLKINRQIAENNQKKAIADDPKIVKRVEIIKKQEDELKQFRAEVNDIKNLDQYIEKANRVNTDFMSQITSKMPKELFLTRFNISNNSVDIAGVSQDKIAVAQFRKGLESIENIESIFVPNITREEDHYLFNLNILLKEVALDGEGNDEEKNEALN